MIGILRGNILSISDQTVILMTTGGVGYEVAVPSAAALTAGDTVELHTYLAVRETALDLYGFAQKADKDFFELLLSVPKIGPKSALQVLTLAGTSLLRDCIQSDDPSRLHKLAGVGKKTAENIVTNLRDKLDGITMPTSSDNHPSLSPVQADAIDALISLGFDPKTARERIVEQTTPDLTVSDMVAKALK